ncbi:cyanophycin synthetase [Candidatus Fermentibacteria bacterium]|nr:cyanophycin synthetase [Candidatus Fermentibacteria bacterium]
MKTLGIKALHGANYYSLRPVIVMTIDLEDYDEVFTSELDGFPERLLECIPSLGDHRCSKGIPGGFVERMHEGTLLTHVIEHVALELQTIAYMPVGFGKTRNAGSPGVYDVIFSYWVDKAGIMAGEEALALVEAILAGKAYDLEATVKRLLTILDDNRLGPSTAAIVEEAERRRITVLRLDDYRLIQLGEGRFQKLVKATITSGTGFIGVETAGDKALTTGMLRDAGIPVPRGTKCSNISAAKEDAAWIGYPVVVKPLDGHHGKGVTIGISSDEEMEIAFAKAKEYSREIVVEQMIRGVDFRLLVVGGRFIAAVRRDPAHVIGDGIHSIERLIEIENTNPRRGIGHEREMTRLVVSKTTHRLLTQAGYTMEAILPEGEVFNLELTANLSTGGSAEDVTDDLHPTNRFIAERVARIIGLDVAGIDILAPRIDVPITETGSAVIEVNAAPGLRAHLAPAKGKPRNVAAPILDMLFPPGSQTDIPIISVTGTNGKTTTVRLAAHIMKTAGYAVGMTCTDGIYIGGRLMVKGDMSGPHSAGVVLRDPTIDCAVLETARGGLLRDGLGYKNADVGIVLNVCADHLNLGNVKTLDDLAFLKSIVAEVVRPGGYSVLNADDPYCRDMARHCSENIAYFSMDPESDVLTHHIERGRTASTYQNGYVTLVADGTVHPLAKAADIPVTLGGAAEFNIQNVMAASLAAFSLGVKVDTVRQGLLSFFPSLTQLPGRMNLVPRDDFWVMIDYAHNPAAYEALVDYLRRSQFRRKLFVLNAVGDRRDEDIIAIGSILGAVADETYLYEDPRYRRGREPGSTTELLARGLSMVGVPPEHIQRYESEESAMVQALDAARTGDVVLVMTARGDIALDVLRANRRHMQNTPGTTAAGIGEMSF